MPKFVSVILFLSVLSSSFAQLMWQQLPLDQAKAMAADSGKPILVYIWADWCIYCKKLKKETFALPFVQERMNDYILVSVNGDDEGIGKEFVQEYGGGSFPTTLFLDSKGVEYNRAIGFYTADSFVKVLEQNLSQENVYDKLKIEFEQANQDGKDFSKKLMTYLEKMMDASRFNEVQELLEKHLSDPRLKEHLFTLRLMRGTIAYRQKEFERSLTLLKVALDSTNVEKEFMEAVQWLGRVAIKLKKPEKRLEYYQLAIDKFGSYKAYNGYAWYAYKSKLELDKALNYANKAVDLSNSDAGVMDTLAHVHYARKEYSSALEVSRKILLKDNSSSYQKAHKKYLSARKKQLLSEI